MKLSEAQKRVLAGIARGENPTVLQGRSVQWLIEKGLIIEAPWPERGLPKCSYLITDIGRELNA